MADARGIHDHASMKLGRRPADPARRVLKLKDVLTGVVPAVPPVDYLKGLRFGVYTNDRFGICGPTSVANSRILVTSRLTPGKVHVPPQSAVDDLYRRSGNPRFNPALSADDPRQDDKGVVMADMLAQVHKAGLDGVKCLAYAQVNVRDQAELDAAVAIFGDNLFGVTLQKAQQAQTDSGKWDFRQSDLWGGHAVLAGGETPSRVVTWAKGVTLTQAFIDHQLDEAWVVIWAEHLSDHGFLAGVDLVKLAKVYTALTGDPFPQVPTPTPPPAPKPTPVPVPPVPPAPTPQPPVSPVDWNTVIDLVKKNFAKALPVLLGDLPDLLAGKKKLADLVADLAKAILFSAEPVKLSLSPEWVFVLKKYGSLIVLDLLSGKSLKDVEADLLAALSK